jgi:glycosyltransferase involved in cell wall biosynthesis
MKLSIIIPAFNEENSIERIIQRTLDAIPLIKNKSKVEDVEIIVVSDGSTDRTVQRAQKFIDKIKLFVFEKNIGYGAAIKEGWKQSTGDLLSFIDADGTCDPIFFGELCQLIENEKADIVIGNRMNKLSRMPFIRKLGNRLFSVFLSTVSSKKIKDTASGMRVVKKSALAKIMPLPDGLNFTPAMSARAILCDYLKICEIDMPYHEREGQSKLHIFKDGIRFFKVITKMIFLYQPQKILLLFSIIAFIIATSLMAYPIIHYIQYKSLEEWMIYRFIVANLLGVISVLFFGTSYITFKIVRRTISGYNFKNHFLFKIFKSNIIWFIILLFFITGILLVSNSFWNRITTGMTNEHWSRYISMSFLITISIILVIIKSVDKILDVILERINYLQSDEYFKYKDE